MKILRISFWPAISCAYAPGYIQAFISFTLFGLSNRKPSKKSIFVSCSVLIDFCHYLCLPLDRFLFEFFSFDHGTIGEVATVVYALYVVFFSWNLNQKGLIHYYAYTNVDNRIMLSFVWRKFSSVGIGEWWDEVKNGQKLKLGDAHAPQEIFKRYKRQSLGMPPRHPFFIGKNQVTFQDIIFLLLHALCIFLGASLLLFLVFFCFVCCNKWLDPNKFLSAKMYSFFICQEHSVFHSYRSTSVLFFRTAFSFHFSPWFCSDLVLSLHQGVFVPLVHVGIHQKSCFKKVRMVLEKRKSFMQKSGTKRSLCRLRLRLLHVMLDVVLIVCLVIFAVAWLVSND
jgi:hypothetical protein